MKTMRAELGGEQQERDLVQQIVEYVVVHPKSDIAAGDSKHAGEGVATNPVWRIEIGSKLRKRLKEGFGAKRSELDNQKQLVTSSRFAGSFLGSSPRART